MRSRRMKRPRQDDQDVRPRVAGPFALRRSRSALVAAHWTEGVRRRVRRDRVVSRRAAPRCALEVSCGRGEFAARLLRHRIDVAAVDQFERMVELSRECGVDARVGDVQDLPFDDREFDVAAANFMLYHVPDLDRALVELARRSRNDVTATPRVRGGRQRRSRPDRFRAGRGASGIVRGRARSRAARALGREVPGCRRRGCRRART
jgi:SAM-dependent methyltransferase